MKYSCLIVDDEPIAISIVKNHLQNFVNIEIEGECANAIEAIEFLSHNQVDLIFLDIQMPLVTGIDLIRSLQNAPMIILTTAYRDYAVDAFDLNVIDYLLKPFSLVRFAKAIGKFYQLKNDSIVKSFPGISKLVPSYLFLKADKKIYKIDIDDIVYIESLSDYVIVHTKTNSVTTKERISNFTEMLPPNQFIRIHRSYIVSIRYIDAILAGTIEIGKQKLPIGRNYKYQVELLLSQHKNNEPSN